MQAATLESQQKRQASEVRSRLWGKPTVDDAIKQSSTLFVRSSTRPGANLPRTGTTTHYRKERAAVDFGYALELVCDDRGLTPDQVLNSHYCASIAARHMLWTVLLDGGHSASDIARRFAVDRTTVALAIASFREFMAGQI